MTTPRPEKSAGIRWSDVFAVSFFGCLMLALYSIIPLLTITAGILTIMRGLVFWGAAIIVLGVLALIGPFYAASRSKEAKEEPTEKSDGV
jgi:hypothetical protein